MNRKIDYYGYTIYYDENRLYHRDDGPAVEHVGNKYWYQHGKRHREDGPAMEYCNGYRAWYRNDKRHREDGPAIEYANGDGDKEWWLEGKQLPSFIQTVEQLKIYIRNKILW